MGPDTPSSLTAREHEELRLLYSVSIGDIAFFKQQQWRVTNYAVALYIALIVIAKQLILKPPEMWNLYVLNATALAVTIAGVGVIHLLQSSIRVRRNRLLQVRTHFSKVFDAAWTQEKGVDDIQLLLHPVVVLGGLFTLWLLAAEA